MLRCFLVVCCFAINCPAWSATIQVLSPSRNIQITVSNPGDQLSIDIFKDNKPVIQDVRPGLLIDGRQVNSFDWQRHEERSFSEKWKPVWGKQTEVLNSYNELVLYLRERDGKQLALKVVVRIYDNGVALRYEVPAQPAISDFTINNDLTSFGISGDAVLYTPNGEQPNLGPINVGTLRGDSAASRKFQTPAVFDMAGTGVIGVHEAATAELSYAMIAPTGKNRFQFVIEPSIAQAPQVTAWRVFMIGDRVGDLLESNLLANLNPPCALEDSSWIMPGVSLWDWRALGAKAGDFTYQVDWASYQRFIDFAAASGIPYMLFDADWYSNEGPTHGNNGIDMQRLIAYAAGKGVGALLYIDRRRKGGVNDWDLEEVLKTYHAWGARGIKYGFLGSECRNRQELVKKTRQIIELCAKYRMLVDFHDHPVPPNGESRTWPNIITREYCHAQSDARRAFTPETFVTAVMVNGIAGALDMNNGYFDLHALTRRDKIGEPVPSTVVAEAARAFIVFSGLTVLPDHPDAYARKRDLFEFVKQISGSWDETKVLEANIGKYIVVARRKGQNWMLGAANDSEGRQLAVDLNFLKRGRYQLTIFSDGRHASAFGDKESYTVKRKLVRLSNGRNTYKFRMAPGGGHAVLITRIADK